VLSRNGKVNCLTCASFLYWSGVHAVAMLGSMDDDLPRLIGTPRQVAWATTIRARFLSMMAKQLELTEGNPLLESVGYGQLLKLQLETQRRLFASICTHVEASWWIDRRQLSLPQLAQAEQRAINAISAPVLRETKPPLH
jgi:hypothetical protein